jgi:hypothetical protein
MPCRQPPHNNAWPFTLRINYRFGGCSASVAARY